jgi:hypothetical protein
MPGPLPQASQGGTSPAKESINTTLFMRMKPPALRLPEEGDEVTVKEDAGLKDAEVEKKVEKDEEIWIQGGSEEDNTRYREFLIYCEAKRIETLRREEEDEERKSEAKMTRDHWELLRQSIEYLKENEERWQQKRIKEVNRIKEEEKKDRLAICKEKKKKYGTK